MHSHDADDILLGMFKQLGVDFKKPREINFYFVFPNEADADNAIRALAQKKVAAEKYKIDVPWWKRLFVKPQWTLSVTREMPLDEPKIKAITTAFQQIAAANHGSYDGWEANVMGENLDMSRLNNGK